MSNFSIPLPFFVKKTKSPRRKIWRARPTRKTLRFFFTLLLAVITLSGLFFILRSQKPVTAAWFNDQWTYRNSVPVTKTVADQTNVYVDVTVDTSAAGQWQADCGDMRWVDSTGKTMQYYLNGACGGGAVSVHVLFPSLPIGVHIIYYYYGNPNATNGFNAADFSTAATNYTVGSIGSQEKSPGPVAFWKFDEGTGQTVNDTAGQSNSGTLGATSAADTDDPTWATENMCVAGKCLKFDGSNDFVNVAGSIAGVKSVSFWVKPISVTSTDLLVLNGATGDAKLETDGSGVISAGAGFTSPTIYVNGRVSSTLVANKWQFVTVTTQTGITASNVMLGRVNAGYLNGFMDEIKLYQYARSAVQVKADYNSRNSTKGSAANLGNSKDNNLGALANGLVGYWKMDETTWGTPNCTDSVVIDASGNADNGKACPDTTGPVGGANGKFGKGGSFDGNNDYVQLSDLELAGTGKSSVSVGAWIYPTSATSGTVFNYGIQTITMQFHPSGDNTIRCYIRTVDGGQKNATSTNTISINSWSHVVCTYDGANIRVYINGTLDGTPTSQTSDITNVGNNPVVGYVIGATSVSSPTLTNFFTGSTDEIRTYNRALSPREISDLYHWAPGPVGYWKLDESTGTRPDSSGYGNNLSDNNTVTAAAGKFGKAGNFARASSQYLSITDASQNGLDITGPITVSAWIYQTSTSAAYYNFVTKFSSSGTNRGMYFAVYNNYLEVGLSPDGSSLNQVVAYTAGGSMSTGAWTYATFTYDGTNITIYKNGVVSPNGVNNPKAYSSGIFNNAADFTIGANGTPANYFDGYIDETRVYNYARTQKQIVEDMNAGHPAPGSPVGSAAAYWKFDEGYNNTFYDSSTLGNNLSLTAGSGSWANNGKFNKTYNFSSSYATINDNAYLSPTTGITLSAWINGTTFSATGQTGNRNILAKDAVPAVWSSYALNVNTTGNIVFWLTPDSNSPTTLTSSTAITTGTWNHIVATWNGSTMKIFINGKQDPTTAAFTGPIRDGTGILNVGRWRSGDEGYWSGYIDELKIYNFELNADEIKMDYNRSQAIQFGALSNNSTYQPQAASQEYCVPGDATSCAAPIAEWKMDEGSGISIYDSSGNDKTGTIQGGATFAAAKFGKGLYLDSTSKYVDMGALSLNAPITFTGWIKPITLTPGNLYTIAKRFTTSAGDFDFYIRIRENGGTFKTEFVYNQAGVWNSLYGTDTVSSNQWHFVAFTLSALSSGNIIVYLDNKIQNNTTINCPGSPLVVSSNFTLSEDSQTSNQIIDQTRIYNYVRTPAQIAWDYNRGGPLAFWKLDECQGGTMHDASGNALNGTWAGGTAVGTCNTAATAWGNGATGKYNSSLNFNGTNDYVDLGSSGTNFPTGTNPRTIALWFKLNSNAAQRSLFSYGDNIAAQRTDVFFVNGSPAQLGIETTSSSIMFNWTYDTNWHLFTAVFPTSSTTLGSYKLYLDGILQTNTSNPSETLASTNVYPKIGCVSGSSSCVGDPNFYYSGQLDDIQIYNYALTPSQIKLLYNQNAAVRFAPLTGTP